MTDAQGKHTGFEAAVRHLSRAAALIGNLILIFILLLTCASVLLRYVFDLPITWADQVTSYGLVYVTFIGAPLVLANRGHVAVDILHTALPPQAGQRLYVFVDIVGALYCAVFTYLAIKEVQRTIERGAIFADAFAIPQWPIYLVIPLGGALLTLQFAANLLDDLRTYRAMRLEPKG